MSYLSAGVALLLIGVLLAIFVHWSLGVAVAIVGGALILYSMLGGRRHL